MRIVFMGTPEFAVPSLDILVKNNFEIAAVITAPDKPAGRGRELQQSPVKIFSLSKNLNILQPANLKDNLFFEQLQALNADLFIVVAFRMLPEIVWKMPPKGTFNLHASLLPQYRGAAPINWAIINGEKETGVTTFFIKQEIDTGEIIFQEKTFIDTKETAGELHDRLMEIGANLVLKTVRTIDSGNYSVRSQESILNENIKLAPKIFRDDCKINWNEDSVNIYNKIRGLSPHPAAWSNLKIKDKLYNCKIYSSEVVNNFNAKPGEIFTDNRSFMNVKTGDMSISLLELQIEGKKRLKIDEFLRGTDLGSDALFL